MQHCKKFGLPLLSILTVIVLFTPLKLSADPLLSLLAYEVRRIRDDILSTEFRAAETVRAPFKFERLSYLKSGERLDPTRLYLIGADHLTTLHSQMYLSIELPAASSRPRPPNTLNISIKIPASEENSRVVEIGDYRDLANLREISILLSALDEYQEKNGLLFANKVPKVRKFTGPTQGDYFLVSFEARHLVVKEIEDLLRFFNEKREIVASEDINSVQVLAEQVDRQLSRFIRNFQFAQSSATVVEKRRIISSLKEKIARDPFLIKYFTEKSLQVELANHLIATLSNSDPHAQPKDISVAIAEFMHLKGLSDNVQPVGRVRRIARRSITKISAQTALEYFAGEVVHPDVLAKLILREISLGGLAPENAHTGLYLPQQYTRFFSVVDPTYFSDERFRAIVNGWIYEDWLSVFEFPRFRDFYQLPQEIYSGEKNDFNKLVFTDLRQRYFTGLELGFGSIDILQKINSRIAKSKMNPDESRAQGDYYRGLLLLEAFSPEYNLAQLGVLYRVHEIFAKFEPEPRSMSASSDSFATPSETLSVATLKFLVNQMLAMAESKDQQVRDYIFGSTLTGVQRVKIILANLTDYAKFYQLDRDDSLRKMVTEISSRPGLSAQQSEILKQLRAFLKFDAEEPTQSCRKLVEDKSQE